MDTLTREFTSYNCTSETLPVNNEGSKPNNLNNFKLKDCNVQNGSASNGDIWKLMSNTTDQTPDSFPTDTPLTRSNSAETLCSDDSSENYHSYDLVASSEGSLVSVHSLAESQASDNRGFYSFVNADSCDNSVCGDSAPSTPGEVKRPMPNPTAKNNLLKVPPPTKRKPQQPKPVNNDPLAIPDDFGKLTFCILFFILYINITRADLPSGLLGDPPGTPCMGLSWSTQMLCATMTIVHI